MIDTGLKNGYNVYADATHLNTASRNKLLNSITEKPTSIEAIVLKVPLETCLERNRLRKGTRGFVPEDTIKKCIIILQFQHLMKGLIKFMLLKRGNRYE